MGEEDSRGQRGRTNPGNERSGNRTDWIGTWVAIPICVAENSCWRCFGKEAPPYLGAMLQGGHPQLTDLCPWCPCQLCSVLHAYLKLELKTSLQYFLFLVGDPRVFRSNFFPLSSSFSKCPHLLLAKYIFKALFMPCWGICKF